MQVAKWGNSLAVRLPRRLVDELGLKAGDSLDVVSADARSIGVAKDSRRDDLLARIASARWDLPAGFTFDREEANER